MATIEDVTAAVQRERIWKMRKWGASRHEVGAWLLLIQAEMHEVLEARMADPEGPAAREELLQVLTLAMACLAEHDLDPMPPLAIIANLRQVAWVAMVEIALKQAIHAWLKTAGDYQALWHVREVVGIATACLMQYGIVERKEISGL